MATRNEKYVWVIMQNYMCIYLFLCLRLLVIMLDVSIICFHAYVLCLKWSLGTSFIIWIKQDVQGLKSLSNLKAVLGVDIHVCLIYWEQLNLSRKLWDVVVTSILSIFIKVFLGIFMNLIFLYDRNKKYM